MKKIRISENKLRNIISRAINDVLNEQKKKKRDKVIKNDEGEIVPKKCDKCGADVKLYIMGEPIYKCSNKKCGKYYGTASFNN